MISGQFLVATHYTRLFPKCFLIDSSKWWGNFSFNQSAFLKGRNICDASLLAHELVRDFSNPMGSRICLKVDLQKAFDTVNREFIYYMFHCMRFPYKWINWITECLSSPTFSIMLNGSPNGYFKSNRGIRQGEPLSPYLFVLVMEFWSITMDICNTSIFEIQNLMNNNIFYCMYFVLIIIVVMYYSYYYW